jgi:hypothetical protein
VLGEITESIADCRPSMVDIRPLSADCRPSAVSGDLALPMLEALEAGGDCGRFPRPRMLGFFVICFFGGGGNNCNPTFVDIMDRVWLQISIPATVKERETKHPALMESEVQD